MTGGLEQARAIVIARDGNACVVCGQRFDEVHHRYRRGMGGSKDPNIHSPVNLLCLCSFHHRTAESLRTDVATPTGLCVPSLAAAYLTPVTHWAFGWALPYEGGTWRPVCPGFAAVDADQAKAIAYRVGLLPLALSPHRA